MRDARWGRALMFAVPISVLILTAFYTWFGVSDRYAVFLYGHYGAGPFDAITVSRYWMSGVVACGLVMIGYVVANWLCGRLAAVWQRRYSAPRWWQVWLICALPLGIGIPLITMSCNQPTLPLFLALLCALVALAALAFALLPGAWAGEHPVDLVWLSLDGLGLLPCLTVLKALEPSDSAILRRVTHVPAIGDVSTGQIAAAAAVVTSITWLLLMTALRHWRRRAAPAAVEVFAAGICVSYLLLPGLHYLLAVPADYRYISAAANFFATSPWVQAATFLVAVTIAWGVTRLRGGRAF